MEAPVELPPETSSTFVREPSPPRTRVERLHNEKIEKQEQMKGDLKAKRSRLFELPNASEMEKYQLDREQAKEERA